MKTRLKMSSLAISVILTGCATSPMNDQLSNIQDQLNQAEQKNTQLQAVIDQSNADLHKLTAANDQLTSSSVSTTNNDLLPPNASAGECYARLLTPASYKTETKELLLKDAGYSLQVTEPEYKWGTESILVKEASEAATLIPAKYEWKTETVLVKEAHEHLKTTPAIYETKSEQILIKSAYTTWKKGRGPIEKLNNTTGEIMCLVEVPAEYKTVKSRVLKTAAHTEKTAHPAEYKEVKKRVMVEAPKMVKTAIPAEYKTVKVKRVIAPAKEIRTEIPATYQTITNRIKVSDSSMEWRAILCETNTTVNVVSKIQKALKAAGHNPGRIDGVLGRETMSAVRSYQEEKGLAVGQFTIKTLESLGVNYK